LVWPIAFDAVLALFYDTSGEILRGAFGLRRWPRSAGDACERWQDDWAIAAFDTPRSPSTHQHTGCHDIHHAAGGQFFVITSAGRAGIGS
jgi:hypothetical protein